MQILRRHFSLKQVCSKLNICKKQCKACYTILLDFQDFFFSRGLNSRQKCVLILFLRVHIIVADTILRVLCNYCSTHKPTNTQYFTGVTKNCVLLCNNLRLTVVYILKYVFLLSVTKVAPKISKVMS